eukprot:Lithocolla_globosa_v1_NODE_6_length_11976_cov_15.425432.p11 type:complete len:151 gc:universal NODE_6_length_11976_cov_15.425432:10883-10431(-)
MPSAGIDMPADVLGLLGFQKGTVGCVESDHYREMIQRRQWNIQPAEDWSPDVTMVATGNARLFRRCARGGYSAILWCSSFNEDSRAFIDMVSNVPVCIRYLQTRPHGLRRSTYSYKVVLVGQIAEKETGRQCSVLGRKIETSESSDDEDP